jgi:hypothetical protein
VSILYARVLSQNKSTKALSEVPFKAAVDLQNCGESMTEIPVKLGRLSTISVPVPIDPTVKVYFSDRTAKITGYGTYLVITSSPFSEHECRLVLRKKTGRETILGISRTTNTCELCKDHRYSIERFLTRIGVICIEDNVP